MYSVNQIVKGRLAGVFVILGFRTIAGEKGVQVKSVNPANYAETAKGEIFLSLDAISPL